MSTLSQRRLWTLYKRTGQAQGMKFSKRDLALANVAFYSGARGVLKVLERMLEDGEVEAMHQAVRRSGRQMRAIQRGGRRRTH
jgi:hypothetical protein